jgi:hypothetical protein
MSAEEGAAPPRPRAHWIVWLFAIVGMLGILAFIVVVAFAFGSSGRPYQRAKVAGTRAQETFTVGSADPLKGTDLVRMNISASNAGAGSYSGRGDDVRNVLLLNRRTGESRRILPDNSHRVGQVVFLPAQGDEGISDGDDILLKDVSGATDDRRYPPAYYLLQFERSDGRGLDDVLVGRLADGKQAVVMTGIDGVDSSWMDSPTRLGLIVRENLRLSYRIVDIPSLKVVENRPIAID